MPSLQGFVNYIDFDASQRPVCYIFRKKYIFFNVIVFQLFCWCVCTHWALV